MAAKFKYRAHISEEGKLEHVFGVRGFNADLKLFAGKDIWLEFSKYTRNRTNRQNSLFHAYVQEIADQTKMSPDRVKRAIKAQFLTVDSLDEDGEIITNPVTGEVLKEVRDTSDLSTVEMSELCENVRIWVMDFGVYLKLPGENEELKF